MTACTDLVGSAELVSYRVTFLAGPEAPRAQALFLVAASGREPEPVFLVPTREVGDHVEYDAVFTQSVGSGSGHE